MTFANRNDLVPAQEKLEWVTPQISLMGADDTNGSTKVAGYDEGAQLYTPNGGGATGGPS